MLTLATDIPEVTLAEPPIVRCLLQLRYSRTPEMTDPGVERMLASKLPGLPVRGEVQSLSLGSAIDGQHTLLRTFESVSGDEKATVGADFVAFETSRYRGRRAFLSGVAMVLTALSSAPAPGRLERLGVRYTNILSPMEGAVRWLDPAVLGPQRGLAPGLELRAHVGQSVIHVDDVRGVQIVSGLIRTGETHDPTIPTAMQDSWVLDIDSFDGTRRAGLDEDELLASAGECAARAYSVFHWAAPGLLAERGHSEARGDVE